MGFAHPPLKSPYASPPVSAGTLCPHIIESHPPQEAQPLMSAEASASHGLDAMMSLAAVAAAAPPATESRSASPPPPPRPVVQPAAAVGFDALSLAAAGRPPLPLPAEAPAAVLVPAAAPARTKGRVASARGGRKVARGMPAAAAAADGPYACGVSKFRGVSFKRARKSKPWKACITVNNVTHFLGYFDSQYEAAKAYDRIAAQHSRETNFPVDAPPQSICA